MTAPDVRATPPAPERVAKWAEAIGPRSEHPVATRVSRAITLADAEREADRGRIAELEAEVARPSGVIADVKATLDSWVKGVETDLTMGATKAEVEPLQRLTGHLRRALTASRQEPQDTAAPTGDGERWGTCAECGQMVTVEQAVSLGYYDGSDL
jgi:hypothetical protein